MRKFLSAVSVLFFVVPTAFADNGIISVSSSYDVKTTADRLEQSLTTKGMTVFYQNRPRSRCREGRKNPAPDGTGYLWKPKSRDTIDAVRPGIGHRPSAESTGLGG